VRAVDLTCSLDTLIRTVNTPTKIYQINSIATPPHALCRLLSLLAVPTHSFEIRWRELFLGAYFFRELLSSFSHSLFPDNDFTLPISPQLFHYTAFQRFTNNYPYERKGSCTRIGLCSRNRLQKKAAWSVALYVRAYCNRTVAAPTYRVCNGERSETFRDSQF
jgi:hypothetical protein